MKKAKLYFLVLSIVSIIVFLTGVCIDSEITDFETRNDVRTITMLFYCLSFPAVYITLLLYDLDAKNLKRLKILHYLLLLSSIIPLFLAYFDDGMWLVFSMYSLLVLFINLLIMTLIQAVALKEYHTSIRIEWLCFAGWFALLIFLMLIVVWVKK